MSKQERPLYLQAQHVSQTAERNMGLWFQKWASHWKQDNNKYWEISKRGWVNEIGKKRVGSPQLLKYYQQRMNQYVQRQRGYTQVFRNVEPFVTGLGLPHPVENGMVWHHLLGVPYIPGSSLKGMLRAWLETWMDLDSATITDLLGSPHQVGKIIFMDMIPIHPVQLRADIMTPHFQAYYSNPLGCPNESDHPIPIPFVTVSAHQKFVLSIVPKVEIEDDLWRQLISWFEDALIIEGIGAKTAVGYGRFQPLKKDRS